MTDTGDTQQPASPARENLDDLSARALQVADAVLAVPGVVRLHPGQFGDVATYLPGGRVTGVRVRDHNSEVHVVVAEGSRVLSVADAVRAVVEGLTGRPVDVTVADIAPAGREFQSTHASSPKESMS